MRRTKGARWAVGAAVVVTLSHSVYGVDYSWTGPFHGTASWNVSGNWTPAGVPNAAGDSASILGAVSGGTMGVVLPSDHTVSTLTIGSTVAGQTVDLGAANLGGGVLILENGAGTAQLNTNGVAGSGMIFSAPVQLGSTPGTNSATPNITRVDGTADDLNFSGGLRVFMNNVGTVALTRQLTLASGAYTSGTILSGTTELQQGTLLIGTTRFGAISLAQVGALQNGTLLITGQGTNSTGTQTVAKHFTFVHGGTVIFNGAITNGGISGGRVTLGINGATIAPTYVFNADSSYTNPTTLGKGDYVINTATPFGTGQINQNSAANFYTLRIRTDNDSRAINNNVQIQQHWVFVGDHSMTFNGQWFQSNNRDLVNNLPKGKTVTFNGLMTGAVGSDGSAIDARRLLFDGSGDTVVNGPIYNHRNPWTGPTPPGQLDEFTPTFTSLTKRGLGNLILNSSNLPTITDGTTSFTGPTSTFNGRTRVQGGLLEFANPEAYGKLDFFTGGSITIVNNPGTAFIAVSAGGAVGVRTGSLTPNFIGKLNAATFAQGNDGGIALSNADATVDADFATGNLSGAQTTRMSLGAVANGATYTGNITPNPTLGYRLGGGGRLTLPNNNQLTGSHNVTVTNGGIVAITGTNNYTGVTTIRGDYIETATDFGKNNVGTNSIIFSPYAIRSTSTLEVVALADGGVPSSIGASSSAASNLVFSGGTLSYVGSGDSTDRLFSVNPVGATLDSSGSGPVQFTNTGAIVQIDAAPRAGTLNAGGNARLVNGLLDVSDLTVGMTVIAHPSGSGTFAPNTVIQGISTTVVGNGTLLGQFTVNNNASAAMTGASLSFGNQNRNLTLSGSNTGNNTLAALLTDSASGRLGLVKRGDGQWSLTNGNSTFTGGVTVNGGTLNVKRLVNNGTTTINAGTLRIGPGGSVGDSASTSVFADNQFSIAGGLTPAGRLDVTRQGVVFDYTTSTPVATIRALITSGYAGGSWTGNGITSSDAAGSVTQHGVGYLESAQFGSGTFLGQAVDSTAVLVRYTRLGDANLDGVTNLGDFSLLGANFNQPGIWNSGDFNYDGSTDLGDFSLLASNFNQSAAGELPRGAVPEPSLAGLLAGLLMARRGRSRR